jgi:hypothetical protein
MRDFVFDSLGWTNDPLVVLMKAAFDENNLE